MFDDEVLTGSTLVRDAQMIKEAGANKIIACCAHGILSHKTTLKCDLLAYLDSSIIDKYIVTNTVPQYDRISDYPKFQILNVMDVIGEATMRMIIGEPVSPMYEFEFYEQHILNYHQVPV